MSPTAIALGFVVNDVATEQENYTTIRLARRACARGHRVAIIGLGDFTYDATGCVRASACIPQRSDYADDAGLLAELQGEGATRERISVEDLDVLMLRSDPAEELESRPWAPNSALLFAQLVAARHVIVLNDPTRLTDASNKTYFQHFPEELRPETCITLDPDEIKSFIAAHDGYGVIKPLQGSGGQSVFVVTPESGANLNQMIDAVVRDGMYFAGLDIVGDRMMEINVDTPGGINMIEELTGVDFSGHIIADLERKVRLRDQYNRTLGNVELAML